MNSHWTYNGKLLEELPHGVAGFIYKITNLENGKMYIGRKYATSTRRKALTKAQKAAGRKRKEVVTKESDWAKYTGSSKVLNEDIKNLGKDKFKFEILFFGNTKGTVNYLEVNFQHKHDVILSDKYYNDVIGSRDFLTLRNNKELKEKLL
jgi:hypothetical protein